MPITYSIDHDRKLVGNTAQFKVSREYHALAKHYSEDAIFDTVERACAWLCGPESPKS